MSLFINTYVFKGRGVDQGIEIKATGLSPEKALNKYFGVEGVNVRFDGDKAEIYLDNGDVLLRLESEGAE